METNPMKFKTLLFNLIVLVYSTNLIASSMALPDESQIRLGRHNKAVKSIAFSPDGQILAVANGNTVKLWNVNNKKGIGELRGHQADVNSIAFSPDGRKLISGSNDRTLRLWNVKTKKEVFKLKGHTGSVQSVAFSPDGQTLVSTSNDNTVRLWDVKNKQKIKSCIERSESDIYSVAFSPNGHMFATATDGHTVEIYSADEKRRVRTYKEHTYKEHTRDVYSIAFAPNGGTFATGSDDRTVNLWNIEGDTGKISTIFTGHSDSVNSVTFSPDGLMLASGSKDDTIKLWNVVGQNNIAIATLRGHSRDVNTIAFSPDGQMLASGGEDREVFLWVLVSDMPQQVPNHFRHADQVNSVAFSPNGQILASASADQSIKLWKITDSSSLTTLTGHTGWVTAVAFSPTEDILASASGDRSIILWSTSQYKKIAILGKHTEPVNAVAFSPDGWTLASASVDNFGPGDGTIKLWNVSKGREITILEKDNGSVEAVAFSPDGQILASGGHDNVVTLWNLADNDKVVTLQGHTDAILTVAFSPNGRTLASGSQDNSIKLWSVSEERELVTLDEHTAYVKSIVFSSDGKVLASASVNSEIKLWSLDDYRLLNQQKENRGGMKSIAFSRNGLLASASNDGTISFWDLSDTIGTPIRPIDNALPKIAIDYPHDNEIIAHNIEEIKISGKVTNTNRITGKVMVTTEDGVNFHSENLQFLRNGDFRQVIPLAFGINQITVTAKYNTGKAVSDKITVNRNSPPLASIHPSETELDLIAADEEMPDFEIISPIFQNSTVTLEATRTIVKVKASDPSGIDEVTVNDIPAQKVGNGTHEALVLLKVGQNPIYLSVKDIPGNVATKRVTIVRSNEVVAEQPPVIQPNSDKTRPNIVILSPIERVVRPDVKNITVTGIVTDDSGIYEIQVNGVDATVLENGGFRATVRLGYGPNPITITATDTKLNTATERIEITRSIEKPLLDTTGPEIRILTPTVKVQRGVKVKSHVTTEVIRITGTVTDPSGIYELTVNGTDVPVSENRFTTTIQLVRGDNLIRVEAIDTLRNISIEDFTVVQKAPHGKKGTDYALLFATESYNHWHNLHNPLFDAQAIRVALQENYGFQVELIHNPTQAGIFEALRKYAEKAYSDEDQLLIFFAGHGYFDTTFNVGYLVAKDTRTPENDNGMVSYLSHSIFRDIIDRMDCKHIFLVMDTCYSGTFDQRIAMRGEADDAFKRLSQADIDQKLKYMTRWYLTSGAKEQVSDGIPGRNSPFVRELLKALRSKGGIDNLLTIEEILTYFENLDNPKPCSDEFGRNEPGSDFLFITR